MRLLLDTQIALWWLTANRRLSKASRELVATSHCELSVGSIWEVAIKHGLGKLAMPPGTFRDEMLAAGTIVLSLTDAHVLTAAEVRRVRCAWMFRISRRWEPGDGTRSAETPNSMMG